MAPNYRENIYLAIDKHYHCDWYFGDPDPTIKQMDLSKLKYVYHYRSFGNPKKLYWQGGLISCLFMRKYVNFFVLSQSRSISFYLFVLLKKIFFPKKKIYCWGHGWYGREGSLRQSISKLMLNCIDGQFVYNNRARNLMVGAGADPNKIFTIYNSLDYDRQLTIRKLLKPSTVYIDHFSNNFPVLLFIGRLTEVKRLDLLLDAMHILDKSGHKFNLILIGTGEKLEYLTSKTKEYGLEDRVWFYGPCYDEAQNAQLIYDADLCVAPGNVGLTAIHTMMFGTPVITHNDLPWQMPEYEAIKPGISGNFFERNNVESLAKSINNWIGNVQDRELVRKACYEEIDSKWNPYNQMRIIEENLKI